MNRPNARMSNSNMQRRQGYQSAPMPQRADERGITVEMAAPAENKIMPLPENPATVTEVRAAVTPAPDCLANLPLAMAYVPWQSWGTVYQPEQALRQGTLFPQLDLPFLRGGRS